MTKAEQDLVKMIDKKIKQESDKFQDGRKHNLFEWEALEGIVEAYSYYKNENLKLRKKIEELEKYIKEIKK